MIPTPAPGFTESSGTLESRPPLAQHPLPVLLGAEPCVCGRSAGPPPPRSCLPPRALHLPPLCLPTQGQNMSLSVLEGMGFRVGQALGESLARRPPSISLAQVSAAAPQAVPGDAGLQGGAGHPQVPVQRPVDGRVPEADGQPPHQPPGDLRPAGQQFPPPHPDGLRPAVSGGSTQVTCAPRPQFLAFTCGLLRGTLCTLGVKSLVTASVAALPACKFQVVIQKS
ncbi:trafficking protein particle complex subunit 6A isoform X12 [Equus asinus]|uniref:trafficking protein particle complex subunit 6A isoform X12 n=1 Tax=Equus asinus TaxID=9793 RepID=UPI001D03E7F1|nr:trafficking protein particle complex subunit 6A isoform X10 [Equus asinus]